MLRSQVPGYYHRLTKEENFVDIFETKIMLGLKIVESGAKDWGIYLMLWSILVLSLPITCYWLP